MWLATTAGSSPATSAEGTRDAGGVESDAADEASI
jgi:hypothetical protein